MKMPPQRTQLQHKFVAYELLCIFLCSIILCNAFEGIKTENSNINFINNELAYKKDNNNDSASSEFSTYAVIRPEIHDEYNKAILRNTLDQENGQHIPYFVLKYYHDGLPVYIELKRNDELLPDQHFLRLQDSKSNSKYIVKNFTKTESELCHYQGSIRGKPHSRVAVSTCNGDINGVVFDSTDTYIIHAERNGTQESQHFLFRASDLRNKNATCGHENAEHEIFSDSFIRQKRSSEQNIHHGFVKANKHSLYVELVLVVDHGVYSYFEEHMGRVHQYCKDLANVMNALYAPLNIFVVLMGVVVWNERDEIVFDNDSRETLDRFLEYRSNKLSPEYPNDHAQLLTKTQFHNNIVGKAFVGPMCSKEKSGAVIVAHSPITAVVANTMAHEMGHVFGMSHDNKNCKCPDKKCIMSDIISSYIPTHWSSCSINNLTQAFSRGNNYCLRNKPTNIFGSSSFCGNGVVELGEECDCGLPNFCKSKCCDPLTCRLRPNATCGSGECCDQESCQLKKTGTVCRRADTECDLSEFCTGESEFCPKDVYKHDTAECSNGAGYCYQGNCGSHEKQCRILWGSAAANSEHCYLKANQRGDKSGNCGFDLRTKEFIKCEEEHVNCGKLQCNHPRDWQKFGMASIAQTWTSYAFYERSYRECRSALFDFAQNVLDPGMTPNGAKCGAQKMCIDQKCISIEKLRSEGFAKSCPENCNGNGICNSEGHCHCDIGFSGSSCRAIGPGGSIDSGPATNSNSHNAFRLFLIIFFCCAIPAAISFSILFYLYRNNALFKFKKFIKKDKTAISEVVCEATNASSALLKPSSNNVEAKPLTFQQEIAKSIEQLNRIEIITTSSSSNSVDTLNLPKVTESIENLTKTFRNSFVAKSASNYELSTLADSTTMPSSVSRKEATPVKAKKPFKSSTSLATRAGNYSNNYNINNSIKSLRPKLEITDVRLQSSTNPLAVALSQGVELIGSNGSNTELDASES